MATKFQLQRLIRLQTALRRLLEFTQARNASDGTFRSGPQVSADSFRQASSLTGFRGPRKVKANFKAPPGGLAKAQAPAARPKPTKTDMIAALKAGRNRQKPTA